MAARRDGTPGRRRASGTGGRGGRDPEIARRIAQEQPYDDDITPDGVVGRRPVPEDALEPEVEPESMHSTGNDGAELSEGPFLLPGDLIYAKVHHAIKIDDDPSNYTYGITTRVAEGETEDEAFSRVSEIVNGRVLDLVNDSYNHIAQMKEDADALYRERVNARGRLRPRSESQQ